MILDIALLALVSAATDPGAIAGAGRLPCGPLNSSNIWQRCTLDEVVDLRHLTSTCDGTTCDLERLAEGETASFYVLRSRRGPTESLSILASDDGSTTAREIWAVEFRADVARSAASSTHASPHGLLLELRVDWHGTGSLKTWFLFHWHEGRWTQIDADGWRTQLELAPCLGLWKDPEIDFGSLTSTAAVWVAGDGNCCPTGGELHLQLGIVDHRLAVITSEHRGFDASVLDQEWRHPYLGECRTSVSPPVRSE